MTRTHSCTWRALCARNVAYPSNCLLMGLELYNGVRKLICTQERGSLLLVCLSLSL
jgi:hypothetical protein